MLSGIVGQRLVYTSKEKKDAVEEKKRILNQQALKVYTYKLNKKLMYNSIIPLKIYQTWHTKNLPENMKNSVDRLKRLHPRFEYFLFDDTDCRNFIANNFSVDVLNAFDSLVPGAYKADLWRYCVLYINGGIYLDIKYNCINSFRFIELTEKEHWVFDINGSDVYNALIACLPKNEILLKCINQVVDNVKNKYYGNSCVDPTGPGMVSKFLTGEDRKKIELQHMWIKRTGEKFILYNDIAVLRMYDGYYNEQFRNLKVNHYTALWAYRQVYK